MISLDAAELSAFTAKMRWVILAAAVRDGDEEMVTVKPCVKCSHALRV
jgi:hypothetical protein